MNENENESENESFLNLLSRWRLSNFAFGREQIDAIKFLLSVSKDRAACDSAIYTLTNKLQKRDDSFSELYNNEIIVKGKIEKSDVFFNKILPDYISLCEKFGTERFDAL
mgnify:CR=1 FL=1